MSDDLTGLDDIIDSGSNNAIPTLKRISIVNPSSKTAKSGGKVGWFNVENTNENLERIVAVPLRLQSSRIWFVGNGTPYFCRSDNGHTPIRSSSPSYKQQAVNCGACPKAKWQGRGTPPQCQQVLDVTFCDIKTKEVFTMSFKGTSLKSISNVLKDIGDDLGPGIQSYKLEMKSEERSYNGNAYYTIVFDSVDLLTEEEKQELNEVISSYKPQQQQPEEQGESDPFKSEASKEIQPLIEIDLE